MKLEIGNFHVKDVQFGTETSFHKIDVGSLRHQLWSPGSDRISST